MNAPAKITRAPSTAAAYVPLRVHSAYTMLEGAIEPHALADLAVKRGFPAIAITDRNGLYGVMAFSKACLAAGVQPVIGTLLAVARPGGSGTSGGERPTLDWLALYAQNEAGYAGLLRLVSAAHLDRPEGEEAHVTFEQLAAHTDGLLCATAGQEGAVARLLAHGQADAANAYLHRLIALYPGRLYLEVSRCGEAGERDAEPGLLALADATGLPLIGTIPACYPDADFHEAHDTMLCIASSNYLEVAERPRSLPDRWVKPAVDAAALFADLPEALDNTIAFARRCAFAAPERAPILPRVGDDLAAEAEQLRVDARAGLAARLPAGVPEKYAARLEFELDVIVQMGFPGYFLIVADFIGWAKEQGIPVGPGRGSGAGSLVAWALTITDIDPLPFGLLFERFLNPERVSMPDFDIDFCETRRGQVISYVQERYGRGRVAQIITFGTMKARAVLKDTGRVLQMSYGQVDRLAKLVPNHPTDPWNLKRALNGVSELAEEYRTDAGTRRLFDLASKLEGLPRHSSTHAAGVVIGDRPLSELVPLYRDPRSDMPVTQFDMKWVEAAGLVKFDFLGLKTLSVLDLAVRMLAERGVVVDLLALPLDDPAVYPLLQRGETVGVFQLESEGMRRALAQVKPTCFADIIALVSLYRPGPMDNIPLFGRRKNGDERVAYPHRLLEPILAETQGIFVYQEQVMQAAQVLAGYSLGEADLLRRAMGKKKQSEMDAQRARFIDGCAANDIDGRAASDLFDLIDKFAGYGFNKSHAAAYALLSYQTAWLKAHHPAEFFAASMQFDLGATEKLAILADDARRAGVAMLAPCINAGQAGFTVQGDAVRYAMAALKGVGERAMQGLVDERERGGAFASLDDLAHRIDPQLLNKRQVEALAGAGAFDGVEPDRAAAFQLAEPVLALAQSATAQRTAGQGGLFGEAEAAMPALQRPRGDRAGWTTAERMEREKAAFGFYLTGHPVDRYRSAANARGARDYARLMDLDVPVGGQRVGAKTAALVEEARWRDSRGGRRFLMLTLSDATGQYGATCWEEAAAPALERAARDGECLLLDVELDRRSADEGARVSIRRAEPMDQVAVRCALRLEVTADNATAVEALARLLADQAGGRGELVMTVPTQAHGRRAFCLSRALMLTPELVESIGALPGLTCADPRGAAGAPSYTG